MRLRPLLAGLAIAVIAPLAGTPALASTAPAEAPAASSAGCGSPTDLADGDQEITVAGVDRRYRLSLPDDDADDVPSPLVLAFHGRGNSGELTQAFSGLSDLPAVLVYPEGLDSDGRQSWQGAPYAEGFDDVTFVQGLLDALEDELCVDRNRIFATGKSNGAGLVSLLACRESDRIAAFAPVAGAYYPDTFADCEDTPPVPVISFHGTEDATMAYDGGFRQGVDYPGVLEWNERWTRAAGCGEGTEEEIGEDVVHHVWQDCDPSGSVEHYAILGGGHTWPGAREYSGGGDTTQTIDASQLMWEFFQRHPLSPAIVEPELTEPEPTEPEPTEPTATSAAPAEGDADATEASASGPTSEEAAPRARDLPRTGAAVGQAVLAGLLLVVGGAGLLIAARRRG